ncbi:cytosine permease [Steroidobacter sp. S1-65]|uniref:Cytosine permease n=1 Tax=Steroidobacter gossypii TaxID=2805490 RepID=A0ABS1WT94_9GAMM|nr:cytosine permease [Steroidobacter gossypii]MBM0104201.1 cytosine permease [Steroidobacter gossypii]
MSSTAVESKTEQFANEPVPESETVDGWRVALILTGFAISLPSFLSSAQIASALGLRDAFVVSLLAGALLCAMGCLTAVVSVRTRLTTYLLVQRSFGRSGAALVNIAIALVHFGWFGVNAAFFGNAMVAGTQEVLGVTGPFPAFVVIGALLMAITTIYGFRALDRLALVAVPILALILGAVVVMAVQQYGMVVAPDPTPPEPMSFGIALSALIGGNMLTVAAMPDLTRYIRSSRQSVLGMVLSFPVAIPLLTLAAAIPVLATGEIDIMRLIIGFGLGVPALLVLILSTWTINSANLYSASLSLTATFPAVAQWKFTLVAGALGALIAVAGILDAFVSFLLLLGAIIPPIAAIYVIDAFRSNSTQAPVHWPAVVTWAVSAGIALLANSGYFTLTTVPALDATLAASLVYGVWSRAGRV